MRYARVEAFLHFRVVPISANTISTAAGTGVVASRERYLLLKANRVSSTSHGSSSVRSLWRLAPREGRATAQIVGSNSIGRTGTSRSPAAKRSI